MTKKQKFNESGDSDDLQALFDQIASGTGKASSAQAVVVEEEPEDGDNDALQALFDEVAAGAGVDADAASGGCSDTGDADEFSATGEERRGGEHDEAVFNRIGVMTRQVHDTLRALTGDDVLKDAVEQIPDARQRLNYIAMMTEQAASRVLNATDIAKPMQDKVLNDVQPLQARWDKLFANELSVDEFKALAGDTRVFLGNVRDSSRATNEQLLEIMMAQDFQDLTGQVIKKVVDLAQTLERELLQLLLEVAPEDKRDLVPRKNEGLLNGPVIDASGRDDVVNSQEEVDDLLDSLGF